jgi:polyphosphate kinase 2
MADKKIMHRLYIELVKLQREVIRSQLKLLVILEGRDAAGKDGTVKALTKHLSPRETRVVALGKPSKERERQWFFQRYVRHLPVSGEFVIFNRSWYNRAGLEKIMGFCSDKEYHTFYKNVGLFEGMLADSGFIILKYYLDISKKEQQKRLRSRKMDPLKQWKLTPVDDKAIRYWRQYSRERDKMLSKTNFDFAPWIIVNADDKDEMHVALMSDLLKRLRYKGKNKKALIDKGIVHPATKRNIKKYCFE